MLFLNLKDAYGLNDHERKDNNWGMANENNLLQRDILDINGDHLYGRCMYHDNECKEHL